MDVSQWGKKKTRASPEQRQTTQTGTGERKVTGRKCMTVSDRMVKYQRRNLWGISQTGGVSWGRKVKHRKIGVGACGLGGSFKTLRKEKGI